MLKKIKFPNEKINKILKSQYNIGLEIDYEINSIKKDIVSNLSKNLLDEQYSFNNMDEYFLFIVNNKISFLKNTQNKLEKDFIDYKDKFYEYLKKIDNNINQKNDIKRNIEKDMNSVKASDEMLLNGFKNRLIFGEIYLSDIRILIKNFEEFIDKTKEYLKLSEYAKNLNDLLFFYFNYFAKIKSLIFEYSELKKMNENLKLKYNDKVFFDLINYINKEILESFFEDLKIVIMNTYIKFLNKLKGFNMLDKIEYGKFLNIQDENSIAFLEKMFRLFESKMSKSEEIKENILKICDFIEEIEFLNPNDIYKYIEKYEKKKVIELNRLYDESYDYIFKISKIYLSKIEKSFKDLQETKDIYELEKSIFNFSNDIKNLEILYNLILKWEKEFKKHKGIEHNDIDNKINNINYIVKNTLKNLTQLNIVYRNLYIVNRDEFEEKLNSIKSETSFILKSIEFDNIQDTIERYNYYKKEFDETIRKVNKFSDAIKRIDDILEKIEKTLRFFYNTSFNKYSDEYKIKNYLLISSKDTKYIRGRMQNIINNIKNKINERKEEYIHKIINEELLDNDFLEKEIYISKLIKYNEEFSNEFLQYEKIIEKLEYVYELIFNEKKHWALGNSSKEEIFNVVEKNIIDKIQSLKYLDEYLKDLSDGISNIKLSEIKRFKKIANDVKIEIGEIKNLSSSIINTNSKIIDKYLDEILSEFFNNLKKNILNTFEKKLDNFSEFIDYLIFVNLVLKELNIDFNKHYRNYYSELVRDIDNYIINNLSIVRINLDYNEIIHIKTKVINELKDLRFKANIKDILIKEIDKYLKIRMDKHIYEIFERDLERDFNNKIEILNNLYTKNSLNNKLDKIFIVDTIEKLNKVKEINEKFVISIKIEKNIIHKMNIFSKKRILDKEEFRKNIENKIKAYNNDFVKFINLDEFYNYYLKYQINFLTNDFIESLSNTETASKYLNSMTINDLKLILTNISNEYIEKIIDLIIYLKKHKNIESKKEIILLEYIAECIENYNISYKLKEKFQSVYDKNYLSNLGLKEENYKKLEKKLLKNNIISNMKKMFKNFGSEI
ncbi:hypothetical protein [Marinitoga sp. 1155]|uniref:hypothetical protein n=1 Tax=Marinitoga sp. 1155 TaxID=1428448 RepID=UPI000641552C|nr:hypothetical protein [Marinitoga sp. 1155]KLO23522.1 hypothetical protein X274_06455 [Marinitoga sp. 1155]